MNRVFLRGDTHGDFSWLKDWCEAEKTTEDDILIILGDAGINFWLNKTDIKTKRKIAECPITLACIQGNHEKRAAALPQYHMTHKEEINANCYIEDEFPNIWFLINGTIEINNKTFLIADGAYSIDKYHRIARKIPWFEDEQMSDDDMHKLFTICDNTKHFDFVLSHTAPMNHEPLYLFLPYVDQSRIDKHTEWILQEIYDKIEFGHWYFGHYHSTNLDYKPNMSILYHKIIQII